MADIESTTRKLTELVKKVSSDGETADYDVTTEKLLGLLSQILPLDKDNPIHAECHTKIEQCGVTLWNLAVAKHSGGQITANLNAQYGNNASMAENPLTMASECLEHHQRLMNKQALNNQGGGDTPTALIIEKEKTLLERDLFKLHCYKAEAEFSEEHVGVALDHVQKAKEFIENQTTEISTLAFLAYNFGVESYKKKTFEVAVTWLKESYDLGQRKQAVSKKNQLESTVEAIHKSLLHQKSSTARTLRLLANTYLEWDSDQHWQKALNAVGLANSEHSHPAGLFLKLRILLLGDTGNDRLKAGTEEIIQHDGLSVDLGINAVQLLIDNKKSSLAFDSLQGLSQKFLNSPHYGRISIYYLELLLQSGSMEDAGKQAEKIITEHHTGKPLELSLRKHFHLMVWEQAANAFEVQKFAEALQWYNYSLSLLVAEDHDKNLAKLHRNRASCFLALSQTEKAEEAIKEAESQDNKSPDTTFMQFKIALLLDKEEEALSAMVKLNGHIASSPYNEENQGLVCLAAQLALEKSSRRICTAALESLVQQANTPAQQVLTALRCLTRLKVTFMEENTALQNSIERSDLQNLLQHIKLAHETLMKLTSTSGNKDCVSSNLHSEALWFMKISWNLALKAENHFEEMHNFFMLCSQFLSIFPHDEGSLVRHKTSLLLAAAACLQVAKNTKEESKKTEAYKTTLKTVDECRNICDKLELYKGKESGPGDTTSPVLLLLYEFEARSKLSDDGVEAVLEKALTYAYAEPKVFETIAALALEPPSQNRSISVRAIKVAIKKHMRQEKIDFVQCSKCFHSLIELALSGGSNTDPGSREEAWGYYMDAVEVIEKRAQGHYPEMETLWLMTKAWNCGIHLYSASKYVEAKRWCELSMGLLGHLGTLKENYQTQMHAVYGEILSKLDAKTHET